MTQSQFLYQLMKELDEFPDEMRYMIVNDYAFYYGEQLEKGLSEEQISKNLYSPKEIAESYKNGQPLTPTGTDSIYKSDREKSRTALSIFKFICLIPVAIIYMPVASVLGLALFLCTICLGIISVCVSVFSFTVSGINLGFIFTGIGGIFFTAAFVFLSIIIFKSALALIRAFPEFMGRVLNNKKKAGHYV